MSVSFLPKGFELEEVDDPVIECPIIQVDELGPVFVVFVKQMPVKRYKKIFEKLSNQPTSGGFRKNKSLDDKVDRDYLREVISGWRGLTVDNFNGFVKSGMVLKGPKEGEIEYSEDAAFFCYRNSFPSEFGDKLWDTLKNGAEEQEAEDKDKEEAAKK